MSNCVSPVLSYRELHYGYEYQICKGIFLQEKIRSTFVWILEIIAAILLAAAFSWFFCRSVVVQEGSMEPTLVPGSVC